MSRGLGPWRRAEHGFSTAAMFVILLPVIIGVFGIGFEIARAAYLTTWVQGRVDNATFTASTFNRVNAQGRYYLTQTALTEAYNNYRLNTNTRRGTGVLSCPSTSVTGGNRNLTNLCSGSACFVRGGSCTQATQPIPSGATLCDYDYGIRYTVREQVPATFLRILGIQTINLPRITGETLVKPRTC